MVTGAAGGFGKATVEAFAGDGCFESIIATDKNPEIETVFSQLPMVTGRQLDIRNADEIEDVVSDIVEQHGAIDILVNSAGIQNSGPWNSYLRSDGLPTPELVEMWETNLRGPILTMQAVMPHMAESGGGTIFTITSVSEHNRSPFRGTYADYKATLSGVVYRFAEEQRGNNIRIINVQPGMHKTDLDVPRKWTAGSDEAEASSAQALYDWWRRNIGADPANVGKTIYDIAVGRRDTKPVQISLSDYQARGERVLIGWDANLMSFMDEHVPGWPQIFWAGYSAVQKSVLMAQSMGGRNYWVDQSGKRD